MIECMDSSVQNKGPFGKIHVVIGSKPTAVIYSMIVLFCIFQQHMFLIISRCKQSGTVLGLFDLSLIVSFFPIIILFKAFLSVLTDVIHCESVPFICFALVAC